MRDPAERTGQPHESRNAELAVEVLIVAAGAPTRDLRVETRRRPCHAEAQGFEKRAIVPVRILVEAGLAIVTQRPESTEFDGATVEPVVSERREALGFEWIRIEQSGRAAAPRQW